jgi:hypothetical protein
LAEGDRLRVEDINSDLLEDLVNITSERRNSLCEDLVILCFATTSWADKHHTVTHLDGIVELDDFHLELLVRLNILDRALLFN